MKKRVAWIDGVRGIAMILVVLGHMRIDKSIVDYIYGFHMPLFFLISGMTYGLQQHRVGETFIDFVLKKAKTLLIPYFFWDIALMPVWWFIKVYLLHTKQTIYPLIKGLIYANPAQEGTILSNGALWFLPALFMTIVLFRICEIWAGGDKKHLTLMILILFVMGICNTEGKERGIYEPWHLRTALVACMFYYIGYCFIQNREWIEEQLQKYFKKWWMYLALCLSLFVVGSLCILRNGRISMFGDVYCSWWLFMGGVLGVSFALILIVMKLPPIGFLNYIGKNSIVYLCFHIPLLRLAEGYRGTAKFSKTHPVMLFVMIILILFPISAVADRICPFLFGKGTLKKQK